MKSSDIVADGESALSRFHPRYRRGQSRRQTRVGFKDLIEMMVKHDLDLARREKTLKQAGYDGPARGAASAGV